MVLHMIVFEEVLSSVAPSSWVEIGSNQRREDSEQHSSLVAHDLHLPD
jgi:hypothetical protein